MRPSSKRGAQCSFPCCARPVAYGGLCETHAVHSSARPIGQSKVRHPSFCVVSGCNRQIERRGFRRKGGNLCSSHRWRKRAGLPLAPPFKRWGVYPEDNLRAVPGYGKALNGFRGRYKRCNWCFVSDATFHVDHIVRLIDGGPPTDESNLQILCEECHKAKSAAERLVGDPEGALADPLVYNARRQAVHLDTGWPEPM